VEKNGEVYVFAAEFFNKKLSVSQIDKATGKLTKMRIIDSSIDQAYSVTYTDVDGDGKADLLVNNHETSDDLGAVFVYSVPTDLINGEYKKKTIVSGFKNVFNVNPNMSPGFCYAVYPKVSETGKGPAHILIAGDGDHSAHLLRP
jgi:DNA-binding beta-propeller fold protein YncE